MDYLDLEAPGLTAGNVEKIAALFPAAVTETRGADGKVKKAVNFEVLKQLLAPDVAEGEERYEFTWVGKRAAMAEAARPTSRTLRPVKADSRDWDTTRNLYIEGDNLEVLKILQESYLGAVKVIYLDPPYNTGSDFLCDGPRRISRCQRIPGRGGEDQLSAEKHVFGRQVSLRLVLHALFQTAAGPQPALPGRRHPDLHRRP